MGQKHQTTLTCDLCGYEETFADYSGTRADWGNLSPGRVYSTDSTGLATDDDTLKGLRDLCPTCTEAVRRSDWATLRLRDKRNEVKVTRA